MSSVKPIAFVIEASSEAECNSSISALIVSSETADFTKRKIDDQSWRAVVTISPNVMIVRPTRPPLPRLLAFFDRVLPNPMR